MPEQRQPRSSYSQPQATGVRRSAKCPACGHTAATFFARHSATEALYRCMNRNYRYNAPRTLKLRGKPKRRTHGSCGITFAAEHPKPL